MKKLFFIAIIVISTSAVKAQDFDLGGKIGLNYSQSIVTNVITSGDLSTDDIEDQTGAGIVFGAFARASFTKFFIQPEMLFSDSKTYIKLNDISVDDVYTAKISKVDVPVLAGFKVLKTIRIMAGPVFSSIKDSDADALFDMHDITMGYQAGIGFDIKKLTFDARYEGSLSKLSNYIATDNGTVQFDSRKNIFQFTVGYKLFD